MLTVPCGGIITLQEKEAPDRLGAVLRRGSSLLQDQGSEHLARLSYISDQRAQLIHRENSVEQA